MSTALLAIVDKVIAGLEMFTAIIPGKWDDLLVSFLKWGRNDPVFLEWLASYNPPAPSATVQQLITPPAALTDALGRWRDQEGIEKLSAAGWFQIAKLVMAAAMEIKRLLSKENQT